VHAQQDAYISPCRRIKYNEHMRSILRKARRDEVFGLLYLASFLLAFHLFFVVYINSSFVATFVAEKFVGSIWIVASVLGIGALLWVSRALRQFGNYNVLVFFTFLEFFIFLGLAFFTDALVVIPLFIAYLVIYPIILFNLDIFLESFTENEGATGSIRGTILTIVNTALIIAPFLAGLILTNGDYWKVYLISALFLIPFLFLILRFRDFKDPPYHNLKVWETLSCVRKNSNVYNIFMAQFILRFFFAWMVIYMPVYLHVHIGFSWTELGIMFAIMLLPFALIEMPAGKIADKWFGEKEFLIAGFIITALFIGIVPFISSMNFFLWAVILFMSRVGASLIEIMTESYFFKHVDGSDNNTIGLFRILRPAAYIMGPAVASLTLFVVDLRFIFFILAVVVLWGVRYAIPLKDTR